jgi:hypothetical protein
MYGKRGNLNPNYGKPRSQETKDKIKSTRLIKGITPPKNMQGKTGNLNPNYGKPRSQETKDKISAYWANRRSLKE